MTVQTLKELLEDKDPNAEVFIGFQPNYPLKARVRGVWKDYEEDSEYQGVFILASEANEYLTQQAWEECETC